MRSHILTAVAILAGQLSWAQVNIIDESAFTCDNFLVDSGGDGGFGYGPGEDFTLTICPDIPGNAIRIEWTNFVVGDDDYMEVFDGQSVSDPLLITLNTTNAGAPVAIPFGTTTGCMTLHFVSAPNSGGGAFSGIISCYVPCEPPIAVATMGMPSPALVCIGETITFDASASTASAGTSIAEYRWNFVDGTIDSLSGAVVTHAYETAGAYTVRLVLTDNSTTGCQSTNPIDLQLLVGTEPDFSGMTLDTVTICLGESVPLSAVAVEAVPWSGAPVVDLGGFVYLPDNLNTPFVSTVTFAGFLPGAVLESVDQLASICVSMEHSYMGDLDLILRCPNGQSVYMHEYPGGTGTYIGDALDMGGDNGIPGICLNYCWTPDATNGTFEESAEGGISPNVQPSTVTPGNSMIIPGDYTSEQPLSQLIGCPLNGTWSFSVVDHLLSDDGNICSWSVTFDPSLYPDLVAFTPVLGVNSPDSAIWSGPGVTQTPGNPLLATATPTAEGSSTYTFSITDNFGCTYDTSMVVTVLQGIPSPLNITGNAQACAGTVTQLSAPGGYTGYEWSNSSVGPNITATPGTYTVTVFSGDCSLESEPFTITSIPTPSPVVTGPEFSCGGVPATLSTTEQYANYAWSNGGQTASITVGTGSYNVTVTENGCSGTSAPFSVTVGSDPQAAFNVAPPSPQGIGATAVFSDVSQGNGSAITQWNWDFGILGEGSTSQNTSYTFNAPGSYPVTLTITAADGCESTSTTTYVILPESIIIPNVFTPNGDANNESFVIENGQFYRNSLAVYNRWGQAVYEVNNYQNAWKATGVPDGTYYYVFKTYDDNKEYTGHVTIVR